MLRAPLLACAGGLLALFVQTGLAQDERDDGRRLADIYKATDVLDMNVVDSEGNTLGDVDDLVMGHDGGVRYVVVGRGGVAGVGEDEIAIPVGKLNFGKDDDGDWRLLLPMNREQLARAPKLTSDTYTELGQANWIQSNAEFFGAQDQAGDVDHPEIYRASKILKTRIVGTQADAADMGRVEDLILGKDWKLAYLILGSGGVLNVGSDFIAVPLEAITFRYTGGEDNRVFVSVKATADQLNQAPHVRRDDYGSLMDPAFVRKLKTMFSGAPGAPTTTPDGGATDLKSDSPAPTTTTPNP